MLKGIFCFLFVMSSGAVFAQDKDPRKIEIVDSKLRLVRPPADTIASFEECSLEGLDGKKDTIDLDRVTIVEYWSRKSMEHNLYWNKMRELEREYADSELVQFYSICYDNALPSFILRKELKGYLENISAPKNLLIDKNHGVRDTFQIAGSVAYLLFNPHGQYVGIYRGDAPESRELFEKHLINSIENQRIWNEAKKKYDDND